MTVTRAPLHVQDDGEVPFRAPVSGVTPTAAAHLATKAYVDAGGGGGVTDHGALTGLSDDDHPQYILADASRTFSAAPTSAVAAVNPTELVRQQEIADLYALIVAGVTIGLAAKQDLAANLTALSGLTGAADRQPYFTGSGAMALATLTSFARTLLDDVDASAARTTLGLGTIATQAASAVAITGGTITGLGTPSASSDAATKAYADLRLLASSNLSDLASAATARTNLGLAALATLATVGTSQIDNDAVTYAKLQNVSATNKILGRSTAGSGDVEEIDCTAAGRALIDDADATAQRATLGLGALALLATINGGNWSGTDLAIADGGTGASTAIAAADALSTSSSSIASAGTTDLSTATGTLVQITGTTTITGFGTVAAGAERVLRFAGALTLTHNATSLILPTAANITTAAGDVAMFRSEGSGNWRCIGYLRADGMPVAVTSIARGGSGQTTKTAAFDALSPTTTKGDLIINDGTNNVRLAAGTTGSTLVADSTLANGMAWQRRTSLWVGLASMSGSVTWTNMPAADTIFMDGLGQSAYIKGVELTGYTQVRLRVIQGAAAFAGARLRLRYATSFSASAGSYSAIGTSEVDVALTTHGSTSAITSAWTDLASGAKADVFIACTGVDGNATADPTFLSIVAEFR